MKKHRTQGIVFISIVIVIVISLTLFLGRGRDNRPRTSSSLRDLFLANNWDLPIDEWNHESISYRQNYYLSFRRSRLDSLWVTIVLPGDSLLFVNHDRIRGRVENTLGTAMKDSLWRRHFDSIDILKLYEKAKYVIDNNICDIIGDSSSVTISLFSDESPIKLRKSRIKESSDWIPLGHGWYELNLWQE